MAFLVLKGALFVVTAWKVQQGTKSSTHWTHIVFQGWSPGLICFPKSEVTIRGKLRKELYESSALKMEGLSWKKSPSPGILLGLHLQQPRQLCAGGSCLVLGDIILAQWRSQPGYTWLAVLPGRHPS